MNGTTERLSHLWRPVMLKFPTVFHLNADSKWHWCLLDKSGVFLAISVKSYDSFEEARFGCERACLSLAQAA